MAYSKDIIAMLDAKSSAKQGEKPKRRAVQHEGGLQIQCVSWFKSQFPAFAKLLFHAKNEAGGHNPKKVAIDAAAGVVPGVPDLILALPAHYQVAEASPAKSFFAEFQTFFDLGIEMKFGKTNNQTPAQKEFQRFYEASGHKYVVVRSLDEFMSVVKDYMLHVPDHIINRIKEIYAADPITAANKRLLSKITHNN